MDVPALAESPLHGRDLGTRAWSTPFFRQRKENPPIACWALAFLTEMADWHKPIVAARVAKPETAHARLRRLTKAPRLKVEPHEPPDILGCFVLLPAGGDTA